MDARMEVRRLMVERNSLSPLRFGPDAPYTVTVLQELVEAVDADCRSEFVYLWSEHVNDEGRVDGVQVSDLSGNRVAVREAGVKFSLYRDDRLFVEYHAETDLPFDEVLATVKNLIYVHLEQ